MNRPTTLPSRPRHAFITNDDKLRRLGPRPEDTGRGPRQAFTLSQSMAMHQEMPCVLLSHTVRMEMFLSRGCWRSERLFPGGIVEGRTVY